MTLAGASCPTQYVIRPRTLPKRDLLDLAIDGRKHANKQTSFLERNMTIPDRRASLYQNFFTVRSSDLVGRLLARSRLGVGFVLAFALLVPVLFAQGTGATGSIQGSVTDPTGAVVPNAVIKITSNATGTTQTVSTTSAGTYNSGALIPGQYVIEVT